MSVNKPQWLAVLALVLLLAAAAGWAWRCSSATHAPPTASVGVHRTDPPPEPPGDFPLVRLPGAYSDQAAEAVEFGDLGDRWLVLVLDPDAAAVSLPVAGTWMAAATIAPAEHLELCRKDDDCLTILSVGRLGP